MRLVSFALWLGLAGTAINAAAQQSGTTPSAGSRVARAVDARVLRAHLEFLADDALEGRKPGTPGGVTAAKYIATQFERLVERGRDYFFLSNPQSRASGPEERSGIHSNGQLGKMLP